MGIVNVVYCFAPPREVERQNVTFRSAHAVFPRQSLRIADTHLQDFRSLGDFSQSRGRMMSVAEVLECDLSTSGVTPTIPFGQLQQTQTRVELVNPLFKCLGWDIDNT